MAWHIVQKLLEQSAEHSTLIGKLWVTSFFVIRLLIVASMAGKTWGDSLGSFVCNTQSPGCKNVCFNEYSPIALIRYWSLQLVCVALPSIIYIVYTAHKMAQVDQLINSQKSRQKAVKEMRKKIEEEEKKADIKSLAEGGGKVHNIEDVGSDSDDEKEKMIVGKLTKKAPSKLFLAYYFVVVARLMIEVGFTVGQYYIYTFKFVMPELFQCQHYPCPNVVDCFVSRPKEKTIFICLFFTTGCILIMLNFLELYHISGNFVEAWKERDDDITKHANQGLNFRHTPYQTWNPNAEYIEEDLQGYPDTSGMPTLYHTRYGRRNRRGRRGYQ